MTYLALGDSISIDKYTGITDGGAASQFARLLGADEFINRTYDGCTTSGVIAEIIGLGTISPKIVTLTAGGNDLLEAAFIRSDEISSRQISKDACATRVLNNYRIIVQTVKQYGCPVIFNTIYDPTDGNNEIAESIGLSSVWREVYDSINFGIKEIANSNGFLLTDLEKLFSGHGIKSYTPWIVDQIEPNYEGASAIASEWMRLHLGKLSS